MASKAPSPRKVAQIRSAREDPHRVITIVDRQQDRSWTIDLDMLGPGDDRECRKATGLPVVSFLPSQAGAVGADSVVVLWWLAQAKAGENVAYAALERQAGSYSDVMARFDVEIEESDPTTPPEGEG